MTVTYLMKNTVKSAEISAHKKLATNWDMRILPIHIDSPVPSDIEISRSQEPKHIAELAYEIGLLEPEVSPYGSRKAKISLSVLQRLRNQPNGKYVVIAGITPTPLGEGKSTTLVGLVQSLTAHQGKNSFACLRQPSQGKNVKLKVLI